VNERLRFNVGAHILATTVKEAEVAQVRHWKRKM
jgi:hypothetical protein